MVSLLSCLASPPKVSGGKATLQSADGVNAEFEAAPVTVGEKCIPTPVNTDKNTSVHTTKASSTSATAVAVATRPQRINVSRPTVHNPSPFALLAAGSSPAPPPRDSPGFSLQQQIAEMQLQMKREQAAYPWNKTASSSAPASSGSTRSTQLNADATRVLDILRLSSNSPSHRSHSEVARRKSVSDMRGDTATRGYNLSQSPPLSAALWPASGKVQAMLNNVRKSGSS